MEKRLYLLGLLLAHDFHGYQLGEAIKSYPGLVINIKKPNAYKILDQLEKEGMVSHREEQNGMRPVRRVYSITDAGIIYFKELLRQSFAEYRNPEIPSALSYGFLDMLNDSEKQMVLKQRQKQLKSRLKQFADMEQNLKDQHLDLQYLESYYRHELDFVEQLLENTSKGTHT